MSLGKCAFGSSRSLIQISRITCSEDQATILSLIRLPSIVNAWLYLSNKNYRLHICRILQTKKTIHDAIGLVACKLSKAARANSQVSVLSFSSLPQVGHYSLNGGQQSADCTYNVHTARSSHAAQGHPISTATLSLVFPSPFDCSICTRSVKKYQTVVMYTKSCATHCMQSYLYKKKDNCKLIPTQWFIIYNERYLRMAGHTVAEISTNLA